MPPSDATSRYPRGPTAGGAGGFGTIGGPVVIWTPETLCTSVIPPVAPVNPRYTFGGSVTARLKVASPSTRTDSLPFLALTAMRWVPVRSCGIEVEIVFHRRPAAVTPFTTPIE